MKKIKTNPLKFSGNAGYLATSAAEPNPLCDYVIMEGYKGNWGRFTLILEDGLEFETIGVYDTKEEAMKAANEHFNKLINEIIKRYTMIKRGVLKALQNEL